MSRILRGGEPRVVPAEVFDAREEAQRLRAEAERDARAVLDEARRQADIIRAEAAAKGREEGRVELAALRVEAANARDRALADAEPDVARLALAAARRLVAAELALHPDRIADIVVDVVGRARRAAQLTVRVSPEDVDAVNRLSASIAARAGRVAPFSVLADPAVTRGGCLVESDLGELDARVEVQLDALARALGCEPP